MKKYYILFIWIFALLFPISFSSSYNWSQNPTNLVQDIKYEANKDKSQQIQNTEYDAVTSKDTACLSEVNWDGRMSITRTLCSLKNLSRDYLQYVMYIGLTAATIFIIRNWFKIVTSSDREKQMWTFKNNMLYLVIWITLLIWFYYIIDLFVSVVNLVAE
jgi:hypothetical protein